jgi:hypothetical protein
VKQPRTCGGCRTVLPPRARKCPACLKKARPRRKAAHLKALDLSYEHYVELNGGEKCGICGKPPKEGRRLHRDHDHKTGAPRGILCFRCNAALRTYITVDWLEKAADYLRRAA